MPDDSTQTDHAPRTEGEILAEAQARGFWSTLGAYTKLSGPGWLQSAITLGGGSLASGLYLGILAGYSMMWLQPLAMILGIVMLSAIGYVTLTTGERPFRAINEHVNPVLGWGWALAVAAANIVWCLPQFSLAYGAISKNLAPNLLGADGRLNETAARTLPGGTPFWDFVQLNADKILVVSLVFIACVAITWSYDRKGRGVQVYELILKVFVGVIVVCFFGVVVVMSIKGDLPWHRVWQGLVPNLQQVLKPTDTFRPFLAAIADEQARAYWTDLIVNKQRDVVISAAATAVGINMTFLFPYSLLRKGWTREFRGLTIFDLATGMFIPFILATGCIVLASATQFHTQITADFEIDESAGVVVPPARFAKEFTGFLEGRQAKIPGEPDLAEQRIAAMLVNRKADDLSSSLAGLTGKFVADYIFGLGVLAMTMSSITILMLISGFVICEMLGFEPRGWPHRLGALVAGVGGLLGPFIWSGKASFYLAVPTSVFGFVLLPFAYVTFMLLMNSKSLLGDDRPRGLSRFVWNTLMFIASAAATIGSIYMVWVKAGYFGIAAVGAFVLLAVLVGINRYNERRRNSAASGDSAES